MAYQILHHEDGDDDNGDDNFLSLKVLKFDCDLTNELVRTHWNEKVDAVGVCLKHKIQRTLLAPSVASFLS